MREPFLEPLLRYFRIRKVLPFVRRHDRCRLLDIGCGWEARLLRAAEPYIAPLWTSGSRVRHAEDPYGAPTLLDRLPMLTPRSTVTAGGAGTLEQPESLHDIHRVLAGGELVLTVPSKAHDGSRIPAFRLASSIRPNRGPQGLLRPSSLTRF
jgi:hypothetical protein